MPTNVLYWSTTALVVAECVGGGVADLFRAPPFYPAMIDLGYPPYLSTIMGTAKLIAAVIVVAPALPRLKEWAYAGILVDMVGAIASTLAMHQSPAATIAPGAFAVLALLSWATRPPSRSLGRPIGLPRRRPEKPGPSPAHGASDRAGDVPGRPWLPSRMRRQAVK